MSMTVRDVVEQLYRYLRKEQRALPLMDPDLDDPLPEALAAMNATLQKLAVRAPKFATQRPMSVLFHAPMTVNVSGLVRGETKALSAAWPLWSTGCQVLLPGETVPNRVLSLKGQEATLLHPYLGSAATGAVKVMCDCAVLPQEVITVLPPVRWRGGAELLPVNGRRELARAGNAGLRGDFGRVIRGGERIAEAYHVDSVIAPSGGAPQVQMRLATPAEKDEVAEFDVRCSLGWLTPNHVFNDSPLPVPAEHVESIFLPLALMRFFGSSVLRNTDAPAFVSAQAQEAEVLLQGMRPQAEKHFRLQPGL